MTFPATCASWKTCIERAVLLETTDLLQTDPPVPEVLLMKSSQSILPSPGSTEILPFQEVERQILAHALKVMDNNVKRAADALHIAPSTLYRKLKIYQRSTDDD